MAGQPSCLSDRGQDGVAGTAELGSPGAGRVLRVGLGQRVEHFAEVLGNPGMPSPSCTTRRARGRCSALTATLGAQAGRSGRRCRTTAEPGSAPRSGRCPIPRSRRRCPSPRRWCPRGVPRAPCPRTPTRIAGHPAAHDHASTAHPRTPTAPELPGSRDSSASGSNPAANTAACLVSGTDPHPGNERIVTCAGQRMRARPRPAGGAAHRAEPPHDQRRVHWISPAPSVSYGSSRHD